MNFVFMINSYINKEIEEDIFQVYQLKIKSKEHRPMNGDSSDEHMPSEYVQDTANLNLGGPIKFKWWIKQRHQQTAEERVFTLEAWQQYRGKDVLVHATGDENVIAVDLKFGVYASGRLWFLEDARNLWLHKFQKDGLKLSLCAAAVVKKEDELRALAEVEIPIEFKSVRYAQIGDAVYALKNMKVTEVFEEKERTI